MISKVLTAIGVVAFIGSLTFLNIAIYPNGSAGRPIVYHELATLCVAFAIACFIPENHPSTVRIIAAVFFFGYAFFLVDSFHTPNLSRAITSFIFWGIPSAYVAIKGE
jgi:uncharacterized membrane protein YgdD (TMEM256/DUF423 family)